MADSTSTAGLYDDDKKPPSDLISEFTNICQDIIDVLVKKNADYGDNNLLRDGLLGIAIRLGDKTERLKTLATRPAQVVGESIDDTLRDIIGYAINTIRLRTEGRLPNHTLPI